MLVCLSLMMQMTRETTRLGRIRGFLHWIHLRDFFEMAISPRWLILALLMQVNCGCGLTV